MTGMFDQVLNAFSAASTASSTSLAPQNGARPITSPVEGLNTSPKLAVWGLLHFPPIRFGTIGAVSGMVVVITNSSCSTGFQPVPNGSTPQESLHLPDQIQQSIHLERRTLAVP